MPHFELPAFAPNRPAAAVDAALRQALVACDRANECAILWFAEVQRRALYRELGHASMELYVTEGLGCTRNRYWQFKRLADDLDRLPVLREAVAAGEIGWTKAQQVARVATPATQQMWVAKAATCGRRELAVAVKEARITAPAAEIPTTINLRADGLQLARFEALLEKVRKLNAAPGDADRMDTVLAGLEALVAAMQGGRSQPAAAPAIQVVVQQCPDCAAAVAVTSRGEKRLAPAQVEALACDVRRREPGKPNRATIPPSVRAAVLARDRHRCTTPGCRSTHFLEVHHVVARRRGGSNEAENLVTLCSRCHGFVHECGGGLAPAQVMAEGGHADV